MGEAQLRLVGEDWGEQQGRGPTAAELGFRAADSVEGRDVAIELSLLLQQVFHQLSVVAVGPESSQQQLGIGAQRRQGIAQLMHHQIDVHLLLVELLLQAAPFELKAEASGDCPCCGLQTLIEVVTPLGIAVGFSPQGA